VVKLIIVIRLKDVSSELFVVVFSKVINICHLPQDILLSVYKGNL
jgi:hypothetical protein